MGKTTYRIFTSQEFESKGRWIRRTMTFVPDAGLTERQKEKVAQKAAIEFENSIELGYKLDELQTFAEYAEYVISLRQANGTLKQKTVERYRELLGRTNEEIGHLKLKGICPQHLNEFYKNLAEDGIRKDRDTAVPRVDFSVLLIAKDGSLYETTTKTADCRFLNIPAETALLLRQWKNEQIRIRLMSGDRWTDTGFVFTTDRGLPVRPDSITAWISDFSKRHGLLHINPHAFRHTVASVLISQGTDVVTVARQLGHPQ